MDFTSFCFVIRALTCRIYINQMSIGVSTEVDLFVIYLSVICIKYL